MNILVIEDNIDILNALEKGFKNKQISCDIASDGPSGLTKLKKGHYNLAIVDLALPKLSGEKIIEKALRLGIKTPILVLTAKTDTRIKVRLLELGVGDYMEKPYSFDELYARINAILRREKKEFPSEYLALGDLKMIPDRQSVVRADKEIRLRRKEYDLLKYFMNHPNKVIDREDLANEVWGYSVTFLSNTVDTHVSYLRTKIDKGFNHKLIRTVYGVGYLFQV